MRKQESPWEWVGKKGGKKGQKTTINETASNKQPF